MHQEDRHLYAHFSYHLHLHLHLTRLRIHQPRQLISVFRLMFVVCKCLNLLRKIIVGSRLTIEF